MKVLLFCFIAVLFASHPLNACEMSYPNENVCPSGVKSKINIRTLQGLKSSVERYYNKRDRFLLKQESSLTSLQKNKLVRSHCFNLRDAEMQLNFILQLHEKKSHLCKDYLITIINSVDKLLDFKSEENQFLKNQKHKLELIDQSAIITSYLEALKMEMGFL